MHRDVEAHLEGFNCSSKDCDNAGAVHPVLVLRTKKTVPFRTPIVGVRLCEDHRKIAKLEDILTDECWKILLAGFDKHNRVRPKRLLTTLDFCPVGGDEARPWTSL